MSKQEDQPLQRRFWKEGQYPTQIPDDLPQPSDDTRWRQLAEYYSRRNREIKEEKTE
jgi:hypothetical protein